MPEPTVIVALLLLVALVESSPWIRLPIGLLLAIALLASDAELLPIALIGAAGVMLARLSLALGARRGRDRIGSASPAAQRQRAALRAQLSGSPAYARMTFVLAALPGVPANFIFPLLGAMRAPLWPALAGTLVGRTPLLAITAALFTWLGRLGGGDDDDAALALGILAALLLVLRTITQIDWRHRAETGRFRMREDVDNATRMAAMFGADGRPDRAGFGSPLPGATDHPDDDVIEGELLGEEVDDEPSSDEEPPPALPPTGLAPS